MWAKNLLFELSYLSSNLALTPGGPGGISSVADPDIQIRGGGGGCQPDPEIRGGGARSPKKFYSALRASVWSKNKGRSGGEPPPLDPPS